MTTEENAGARQSGSPGADPAPETPERHDPQGAPDDQNEQRAAQAEDPTSPARGFDDIEAATREDDE